MIRGGGGREQSRYPFTSHVSHVKIPSRHRQKRRSRNLKWPSLPAAEGADLTVVHRSFNCMRIRLIYCLVEMCYWPKSYQLFGRNLCLRSKGFYPLLLYVTGAGRRRRRARGRTSIAGSTAAAGGGGHRPPH